MAIERRAFQGYAEPSRISYGILLRMAGPDAMPGFFPVLMHDGMHLMPDFVTMSRSGR